MAAAEHGRGLPFVAEVSAVIWGGKVIGWHEGAHLAEAAARAGLDLGELDAAIAADPGRHDGVIAENQRALEAASHWGVPTMVFGGEPSSGRIASIFSSGAWNSAGCDAEMAEPQSA